MGCSSAPSEEGVGTDQAAVGTGLSFTRVSYSSAYLNVDGNSGGGTADVNAALSDGTTGATVWGATGSAEYSMDFSTFNASQRANWSAAIGAGTARIRTNTQEYVVSVGSAAAKLAYATTIERNGVVVYTCSGDIVEQLGSSTNTNTLCDYTLTSYSATDIYVVRTAATARALCFGSTSGDQARVQSRLIGSADTDNLTVALWRP